MDKLVIDSSVFISIYGKKDVYTTESRRFFERLPSGIEIIIPSVVVAETLTVLTRQNRKTENALKNLLSLVVVPLDIEFLEKFSKLLKPSYMRSFDTVVAATTKLNQTTLISWDRRHLSKDNYLCSTLTPKQYIDQIEAN